ncbi:MAG: hypothetical protein PHS52_00985 [Desulfotomaculaceae bacterium]|nr:hypothetical protein [Desulfotomaculaceae bacterium]
MQNFWRGIITGGIIGATISMVVGGRRAQARRSILGMSSKQARSRANRVLRGVTKTVNDLIR